MLSKAVTCIPTTTLWSIEWVHNNAGEHTSYFNLWPSCELPAPFSR